MHEHANGWVPELTRLDQILRQLQGVRELAAGLFIILLFLEMPSCAFGWLVEAELHVEICFSNCFEVIV